MRCYLNSTLQLLFHAHSLRTSLTECAKHVRYYRSESADDHLAAATAYATSRGFADGEPDIFGCLISALSRMASGGTSDSDSFFFQLNQQHPTLFEESESGRITRQTTTHQMVMA